MINNRDSPLSKEFSSQFPYTNIFDVLGLFSTPIPFGDILPETNKNNFVDILIWLLRKDVLVQLHDYVYLLESSLAKERLLSRSFSKASDSELELIDQLTQGKPATLANLFRRFFLHYAMFFLFFFFICHSQKTKFSLDCIPILMESFILKKLFGEKG